MGFISRRVMPACAPFCCCFCPGLRARSRVPIKRYNQFLGEIFKSAEKGTVNDRQIGKLSEYAEENPDRIPQIVSKLEDKGLKDISAGKTVPTQAIMRTFSKLLSDCGENMPLLALPLTSLAQKLLDSKTAEFRALGCQATTEFLDSQADSAFSSAADALLLSALTVAKEPSSETDGTQAAALGTIRSYICFNAEFNREVPQQTWDQIIAVVLGSYPRDSATADKPVDSQAGSGTGPAAEARAELQRTKDMSRGRPYKGKPSWENTFPSLSRESLQAPNVGALSCVWALALLHSSGSSASPPFMAVLQSILAYVTKGSLWASGFGLQVLEDLRDAFGLLGASVGREWQMQFHLPEALISLLSAPSFDLPAPEASRAGALSALLALLKETRQPDRHTSTTLLTPKAESMADKKGGAAGTSPHSLNRATTFNSGYAAGEVACIESLTSLLARILASSGQHGAQATPATGEAASAVPGSAAAGDAAEPELVACVAELGRLVGSPEEFLDALGLALEGIPSSAVDETLGVLAAIKLLAPAGLERIRGHQSSSSVGPSGDEAGAAAEGKEERAAVSGTVACPQLLFNAVLQTMMHQDPRIRTAAHELLASLAHGPSTVDLSEEQRRLLLSALWLEGTECNESLKPGECVVMLQTFRTTAGGTGASGGAALLPEASRLALSLRAKAVEQDTLMSASCQRSLLALSSAMLLSLSPSGDGVSLPNLEPALNDPFLEVSPTGELSEKQPGSPGFGTLEDKEKAAQVLSKFGSKSNDKQAQQKIAEAGAGAGASGALELFQADQGVSQLRFGYLASGGLPPSASPSVILGMSPRADPGSAALLAPGQAGQGVSGGSREVALEDSEGQGGSGQDAMSLPGVDQVLQAVQNSASGGATQTAGAAPSLEQCVSEALKILEA